MNIIWKPFAWLSLFLAMQGRVEAQVHFMNQGARVRIDSTVLVHVTGNVHHPASIHQPGWNVAGKLTLTRNWQSSFFVQPIRIDGQGEVWFQGTYPQWIDGLTPTHFSHLTIDNPEGLHIGLDIEAISRLRFLQGKIFSGNYTFSLRNPEPSGLIGPIAHIMS